MQRAHHRPRPKTGGRACKTTAGRPQAADRGPATGRNSSGPGTRAGTTRVRTKRPGKTPPS
eukprot:522162-Lingulodinium_polyedra.AAC.1